jgi:hypothetical protein
MVAAGSGVRTSEVAALIAAMSPRAGAIFILLILTLQFICPSRACVDVERARLLHHHPLHQSRPDAERLTDLQYAHAGRAEALGALQ